MQTGPTRFFSGIIACLAIALAVAVSPAFSQYDSSPESPTPVIVSEDGSTRALTSLIRRPAREGRGATTRAFQPGSTATIFVSNISLMGDEGANSLRVWGQDARGKVYRFPVVAMYPLPGREWVYAVSIVLKDEIKVNPAPQNGDLLINLVWRGNTSNRVRLGYGAVGGNIKDDAGSAPTPMPASPAPVVEEPASLTGEYRYSRDITRFLEQSTFGPNKASEDRVRILGLRGWINEQLKLPYSEYLNGIGGTPDGVNGYPVVPLKSIDSTNATFGCGDGAGGIVSACFRFYYTQYEPQTWFYKYAMYGDQQLRHRVAWALSQIWVTSALENNQASWMIEYHKILSKNAFGNWRNLMYDMTLSPAMGNYLDMIRSTKTSPNENYAREIMQLFNVGLFMLNQDGTLQTDSQGNPIDTYSQANVDNLTKVLTGWALCETTASCPNRTVGAPNYRDPMLLATGNHDLTAKTLLDYPGVTTKNIAACSNCTGTSAAANINTYANNSLNQAIDNLYYHPNTAPFVSKILIQNLVMSDPSPAYVGRVASVFTANRTNPTQMQEVIKAILLDPEARGSVKTDPRYGKFREPVLLVTNLLRQFNATGSDGVSLSDGAVNRFNSPLGQSTFYPATVFNYYPFDYVIPGTTVPGPEFGLVTTGTSIARSNMINSLVYSQITASSTSNTGNENYAPSGTKLNFSEVATVAAADTTSNQLIDYLNSKMMHGTMSPQMRSSILTAVNTITGSTSTTFTTRAQTAVFLIATSSQYQVQR